MSMSQLSILNHRAMAFLFKQWHFQTGLTYCFVKSQLSYSMQQDDHKEKRQHFNQDYYYF